MTQAVSCQPLTVEAQIQCQVRPRGICGGQSGTGYVYLSVFQVFIINVIPQYSTSMFPSSTTNNNN